MRHTEAAGRAAGAQPGDLQVYRRLHDRGGRVRGRGTGGLSGWPLVGRPVRASSMELYALWRYGPSPQEVRHAVLFVPYALTCVWVGIRPSAVLIGSRRSALPCPRCRGVRPCRGIRLCSRMWVCTYCRRGCARATGGDCGVPAAQMDRQEVRYQPLSAS